MLRLPIETGPNVPIYTNLLHPNTEFVVMVIKLHMNVMLTTELLRCIAFVLAQSQCCWNTTRSAHKMPLLSSRHA